MADVRIDEAVMAALANLLREATASETKYYPADMPPAFRALLEAGTGGGGEVVDAVLVPLEITENGTYTPPAGTDGFNSVTVNVEQGVVEEPVLTPLEVSQNGVYVPGEGVDGFSSITVNVPSADIEKGIVVNATDASGNWTDVVVYGDFPATIFEGNAVIQKVVLIGVTGIPDNSFDGCTALTSISIPEGVTSIGGTSFRNCSSLTEVDIPSTVTSVGARAFLNCTALTKVRWNPTSISSIGSATYPPFAGCTALTDFVIAEGVTVLPENLLRKCTGIVNITIPDSVTSIRNNAFNSCTNLARVQIGVEASAIASISSNAFNSCSALADITIYKTANSIAGAPWGASNATVTWAVE